MCLHAHIEKNHYLKNNSMIFFYTQAHWRLDFVPHSCKLTPQHDTLLNYATAAFKSPLVFISQQVE